MAFTEIDGINTRYELAGSGPPLLMLSPGGFNARLENWSTHGVYRGLRLVEHLSEHYTCIRFDKRESGASGGRVECVTWRDYAVQARGLMTHLGIPSAHVMGGCVGCSIAGVLATSFEGAAASLVMYSPAGGPRYRMLQHKRIGQHVAFAEAHGLAAVVALAKTSSGGFSDDPRLGPWVSTIRTDPEFEQRYADEDLESYLAQVRAMALTLFDRDTVPGPSPEALMGLQVPALIVPGDDASHATSAARYLSECLPDSDYWDVPVAEQTQELVIPRILEFLGGARPLPPL